MSTLSQLVPLIYHERQEKGSMLCAQHALNNLLQEHCFSVPDLSTIARGLDELEESYNEGRRGRRSSNMDDTGFFSLQVLQKALEVWSLSLVSWRSEEMSAYTSHPHTQLAFILNLNEHWFTLRRFGAAPTDVDDPDPGQGHWFNLDSFLRKPEWVGSLYLSMVLQQSEQDGYSVFAVKRSDPSQTAALRETEADTLAARLPDPNNGTSSLAVGTSQALFPHAPGGSRSGPASPSSPSPRSWEEERSHSPMHQLLERAENDRYRDTSYPPYMREPPRRPRSDAHEGGLGGFERLDHPDDDPELQAALEDRELQAALQASLMSGLASVSANQPFFDAFQPHSDSGLESPLPLPIPPPLLNNPRSSANRASATSSTRSRPPRNRRSMSGSGSNSGSGSRTQSRRGSNLASPASIPNVTGPEVVPDLDPVAASVARNRVIMERMRREQEMALRDTYEDVDMEEVSRRSREAQEEDMMLRRAIEESEKLAKEEGKKQQDHQDQQPHAGESSSTSPTHISSSLRDDRVYDDEDEELQAALRASLQDAPSGYQPQPFPPPSRRRIPEGLTLSRKQTLAPVMGFTDLPPVLTPSLDSGVGTPRPTGLGTSAFPKTATVVEDPKGEQREMDKEESKGKDSETQSTEGETEPESGSEMEGSFDESKEEQVSMEEMRKRRLARFGG